ncbi:MAG TPA: hypothetical protein PKC28_16575 [Bdellovibrionales bacterium]|nr:hypothetical protein [Bdellovibrionales bacterium]
MSLATYFENLLKRVEGSDEIQNDGKDKDGFYKPTRTLLVRHLNLLKDLHAKPAAKPMVKSSWSFVTENLPPDWLVLSKDEKEELKKVLGS